MPASPSMYVTAERHDAGFVYAGAYVIRPKSSSSTLIWRKSMARTVPSVISISYVWPVRLSVTVSVSPPCWATPSPVVVVSVLIASPENGGHEGRSVRRDRPAPAAGAGGGQAIPGPGARDPRGGQAVMTAVAIAATMRTTLTAMT